MKGSEFVKSAMNFLRIKGTAKERANSFSYCFDNLFQ